MTPRRIFLAESLRCDHLGLSDEAYLSIHQLAEFGLIDTDDPVEGRRRGRIPPELTSGNRPDPYNSPPPFSALPTLWGSGVTDWDRVGD
jgi:hypothetical protein